MDDDAKAAMIRQGKGGVLVDLLVQPRASRAKVGPVLGNRLKVAVTAPPVDGKANAQVIAVLARALGLKPRQLEVESGHSSRRKTVRVAGASCDEVLAVIEREL